ncbi:tRNA pseudouridine(55) synthase [Lachnospiraceae bacterium MD308]|nr:tRNA pseudouridine(55) synthase [Lachnospiraceae bacterium MD308]
MIHGVMNVHKEKGYTSHDVVAKLRRITGQKKIGHTGTLDPDATGVLPVCLGKGTKLCGLLTDEDKTYETVLLLGKVTDTQDISGRVLSEKSVDFLTAEDAETAVFSFLGEYGQMPPMYSALKVNGKKLYELARNGQTVERKIRRVNIADIKILEINLPRVRMAVTCSKGTYIRTLCHDIGEKLGCGGCMEELTRTRVGRFAIEDSRTLEEIEHHILEGKTAELIVPVDEMFDGTVRGSVADAWESAARNGGSLPKDAVTCQKVVLDKERVRLYDREGRFIALYRWREETGEYGLEKMFFPEK